MASRIATYNNQIVRSSALGSPAALISKVDEKYGVYPTVIWEFQDNLEDSGKNGWDLAHPGLTPPVYYNPGIGLDASCLDYTNNTETTYCTYRYGTDGFMEMFRQPFTYNTWFNIPATSTTKHTLMHVFDDNGTDFIHVDVDHNISVPALNVLYTRYRTSAGTFDCDIEGTDWFDGAWHMYTLTVGPSELVVYIDGIRRNSIALDNDWISGNDSFMLDCQTPAQQNFIDGFRARTKIFEYAMDPLAVPKLYTLDSSTSPVFPT